MTAYYEIPSKHPPQKYHKWMKNFLSRYEDTMVIFTSPNLVDLLANLRRRRRRNHGHNNNNNNGNNGNDDGAAAHDMQYYDYDYDYDYFNTIIVALPLEELPLARLYPKSFWIDQLNRDPQSKIHSPLRGDPRLNGQFESGELYWIWLSKVWFVQEAMKIVDGNDNELRCSSNNSKKRDNDQKKHNDDGDDDDDDDDNIFAWVDIGSFREEVKEEEIEPQLLIRHPEVVPSNEMLFWSHYAHSPSPSKNENENQNQTAAIAIIAKKNCCVAPNPPLSSPYFDDKSFKGGKHFFHAGAHFAGRQRSIQRLYRHFLHTIDEFVKRNLTLADDQAVMQSTCLSYYNNDEDDDVTEDSHSSHPANLCAYATRNMVSGKSKWFGLTTLFQEGLEKHKSKHGSKNNTNETVKGFSLDLDLDSDLHNFYWRPPPPEYYHENQK